ncbi:DUF421 domain-containing protein [Salinithrix halophila]|uniref:DUF421 domain-containing protein n=1 Tax=Salinithrix halophila TaxID=1485204 RepID=A0ABV8JLC0_9BACL
MSQEILVILGRIVTIFPLLLIVTLYMGRRSIGELPVFDFMLIITLGSIVGADIADPSIHHFPTAITVIAVGVLQRIISRWAIQSRKFGRLITFEPVIVIWKGQLLEKRLRKIRYPIDSVLSMLREQQIFDLSEVDTAVLEHNGKLSIHKKPPHQTVTKKDLHLPSPAKTDIPFPVIVEGKMSKEVLSSLGLNEDWLQRELDKQGLKREAVFFGTVNENNELTAFPYVSDASPPPLRH